MPAAAPAIDHKIFLARIPPKTRQLLLGRSDRAGLVHLGLHWGATALVSVPIYTQVPFWWALLPVQGILIIFNFTLLHECTHQSPFRSLWLNEAVGWITGAAVGLPFIWFRYFHLAHHRFTNDPARDPELAGGPRPQNLGSYTLHITGLPVWKSQVLTLFSNAVGGGSGDFLPKSVEGKIQIESILLLLFYIVQLFIHSLSPVFCCGCGSFQFCWDSHFCGCICWPNMAVARLLPVCWKTRGPLLLTGSSDFWPGTCLTTRNITVFRWCRFTNCLPCTNWQNPIYRPLSRVT